MSSRNPSFLNGVPELLVLQLLTRREMYGYEIVREIEAQSRQALTFGEGCIYPYLHYLEAAKLVSSRRQVVDGRNRNYYKLTSRGRRRLEALNAEWTRAAAGVSLLLEAAMRSRHEKELLRELAKLGCPVSHARRMLGEIADHREDLREAAMQDGLNPADMESRVDDRLGCPALLAQRLVRALRQSSWCGRHPLAVFGLTPLLVAPFASMLGVLFAVNFLWSPGQPHTQHVQALATTMKVLGHISAALPPLLFCWLARRSALPLKWLLLACLICSGHAWFAHVIVTSQHVTYGYFTWAHHWVDASIPLLIGLVVLIRRPSLNEDAASDPAG